MDLGAEIIRYSRMAFGIFELARTPAIPNPVENLRHNLENRDANFLDLVSEAVYANPQSPYSRCCSRRSANIPIWKRRVHLYGCRTRIEASLLLELEVPM